jgi:hypothetical protein
MSNAVHSAAAAAPCSIYPYEAACSACGHKSSLSCPEHAYKTDDGKLDILHDYRVDLAKHGQTWPKALAAKRIQNIFRFLCTDCGQLADVAREYEPIEAGCTAAGWVTLFLMLITITTIYFTLGGELAFLAIPAAPFYFFMCSELVEWPHQARIRKLGKGLSCEQCKGSHLVALMDARECRVKCPKCGEKALRYLPVPTA